MFKDSITWLSIIVNVSSRLSGITQLGTFIKMTEPSLYINIIRLPPTAGPKGFL